MGDSVSISQGVYHRSYGREDEWVVPGVNGSLADHPFSIAGRIPVPDELDYGDPVRAQTAGLRYSAGQGRSRQLLELG